MGWIFDSVNRRALRTLQNISLRRKYSISMDSITVAVVQMCSVSDKQINLANISKLVCTATTEKPDVKLVCLPECCIFMGLNAMQTVGASEDIPVTNSSTSSDSVETLCGTSIRYLCNLANTHKIWLSVGGFPEKRNDILSNNTSVNSTGSVSSTSISTDSISNSHIIINPSGEIEFPIYRKIHLFDSPLAGLHESKHTDTLFGTIDTAVNTTNVASCANNTEIINDNGVGNNNVTSACGGGAEIVLVPSAFTQLTGKAHWELLLRARAVENQCYVIAAAQSGQHNEKRSSYGHSMVVDPWGTVVSQLHGEDEGLCYATISRDFLNTVRKNMPVQCGTFFVKKYCGSVNKMSEYIAARHLLNPKTMRVVQNSGSMAIPNNGKKGNPGNFPSSPTDNILSPCSKKLWRGKRISSPDLEFSLNGNVKPRKFPCPGKSLILGSSSEGRKSVINALEWKYAQMSPNIDEKSVRTEAPLELPVLVAQAKAAAIMNRLRREGHDSSSMVITADQIVLYKQMIREKPESEAEAIEFLSSYSSDSVMTVSAVVVTHYPSGLQASNVDLATVYFKYIDDEVVKRVVGRGMVYHTAGGFCTEDPDLNKLIKGVDGSMDSVFGLPVDLLERLINEVLIKCDDYYADRDAKDFDPAISTPTRFPLERNSSEEADSKRNSCDGGRMSMGSKSLSSQDDDYLMFGAPN